MGLKGTLLSILGFACLGLGVVGVAIPVMPTTPFVLLAAVCFSTGNKRLGDMIQKTRFFGPFIEHYRTRKGISRAHKIASIAMVWTGLIISMAVIRTDWAYILLGLVGAGVTIHLALIKAR